MSSARPPRAVHVLGGPRRGEGEVDPAQHAAYGAALAGLRDREERMPDRVDERRLLERGDEVAPLVGEHLGDELEERR